MTRTLPALAAALSLLAVPAVAGPSAAGTWIVADGSTHIAIRPCDGGLCGTVSYSKAGTKAGTVILRGMAPAGEGRWKGTVLDPRSGSVYQSTMTLKGEGLRVQGCVMGVLCGGETWTRQNQSAGLAR